MHCHILPELDDGATSMKETLEMIVAAKQYGITNFIATPHFSQQFQNNDSEKIRSLCKKVQKYAKEKLETDINIYPGQEILYCDEVLERLSEGKLLTLAGSNYILLEFQPQISYLDIYRIVREVTMNRYFPILAHVERYSSLQNKEKIEELIKTGAYLQMNYYSLAGRWYKGFPRWCKKLLKEKKIHFLSTDMHRINGHRTSISQPLNWLEKHLDKTYLNEILYENAVKILQNEKI